MDRPTRRRRSIRDQQGQAIVLFAFMLSGMLLMSTLLFDAANALVMRLRLQDSADGAALAILYVWEGARRAARPQ